MKHWYQMSKDEIFKKLNVSSDGLTDTEAKELLEKNGVPTD